MAGNILDRAFERVKIPRLYTLLRWAFLVVIAVSTALVGFFQSMLVSWLYELRSQFIYSLVMLNTNMFSKFLQYTAFNLGLAFACSFTLYLISPAASGSGIPDVKAYLNGVESPAWANFFTIKTFVAKVICSALAVSASLIMGKEGPMLHAGSILAVILGSNKWMQQQMQRAAHWGVYTYNKDERDLVAIGAACGVCTAFKAPVGGVMFAMEIATRWSKELTYKSFLAVAITILVVREAVTLCTLYGHCSSLKWGSLIWFQIKFPTPYLQVWAIILLAIIGGYLGCLFTSFNTWVCLVRKHWAKSMHFRILEVCAISVATSIIFFFMPVAGRCKACDSKNDDECLSGGAQFKTFQGFHCHTAHHYNDMATLVFNPQGFVTQALFTAHSGVFSLSTLALYSLFYWLMAAITYGAFIPSGVFTPSLIFGGCFGRMFAEVLVAMHVASDKDVGLYALLGAASFLGGLMRMSAAQALILMEMTQSPAQLPFLMLVLVVSKNIGDAFNYSVFDHQMMLKSLPFVGIAESNTKRFHINANDVMAANDGKLTLYIIESGKVLAEALDTYKDCAAFPVTTRPSDDDAGSDPRKGDKGLFCGMISRRGVAELLEKYGVTCDAIDLSTKVEIAPIAIPPNMPLPFIYRIVNAEGFNYVPVIRYLGPLEGVVSRKELVDVQNQKLDTFHLKEQIERMEHDIDQGKIIGSMQLNDNIHAQAFRRMFQHPLAAMKEVLDKDDKLEQEQDHFYMDEDASNPSQYRSRNTDMPAELVRRFGGGRTSVDPSRHSAATASHHSSQPHAANNNNIDTGNSLYDSSFGGYRGTHGTTSVGPANTIITHEPQQPAHQHQQHQQHHVEVEVAPEPTEHTPLTNGQPRSDGR